MSGACVSLSSPKTLFSCPPDRSCDRPIVSIAESVGSRVNRGITAGDSSRCVDCGPSNVLYRCSELLCEVDVGRSICRSRRGEFCAEVCADETRGRVGIRKP